MIRSDASERPALEGADECAGPGHRVAGEVLRQEPQVAADVLPALEEQPRRGEEERDAADHAEDDRHHAGAHLGDRDLELTQLGIGRGLSAQRRLLLMDGHDSPAFLFGRTILFQRRREPER